MRVSKGVYDEAGNIDLVPVSPEDAQQSSNALFYFGGNMGTWRGRQAIEGSMHVMDHVLGEDRKTVDVFAVAYNNHKKNWQEIATINQDVNHVNPEVEQFVDGYLLPVLEQGTTKITLFGYSYGSAFAEMARRTLITRLKEKDTPDEEIHRKLGSILLVSVCGVANTMDEGHSITAPMEYSAIMIDSQNDCSTVVKKIPALQMRQRILEERNLNQPIVVSPLSANRVEVSIPVDPSGDQVMRWNTEERKMEPQPPRPPLNTPPAHQMAYYMWPNNAIHPDGGNFVSEVLRYAITRPQETPDDLLTKALEIKDKLLAAREGQEENSWVVYARTPSAAAINR